MDYWMKTKRKLVHIADRRCGLLAVGSQALPEQVVDLSTRSCLGSVVPF